LRQHRRSPRTEADAGHVKAKTELLQIKIEEKKRTLVRRDAADELIDQIAGTVLTHLSGMAARCSRDMVIRQQHRCGRGSGPARDRVSLSCRGGRVERAIAR
jgi:hypothetical protein